MISAVMNYSRWPLLFISFALGLALIWVVVFWGTDIFPGRSVRESRGTAYPAFLASESNLQDLETRVMGIVSGASTSEDADGLEEIGDDVQTNLEKMSDAEATIQLVARNGDVSVPAYELLEIHKRRAQWVRVVASYHRNQRLPQGKMTSLVRDGLSYGSDQQDDLLRQFTDLARADLRLADIR